MASILESQQARPLSLQAAAQPAAKPFFKPFLVTAARTLTYGELRRKIGQLTRLYADRRLAPGTPVLLAVKDDIACVELFLSLLLNGLVPLIVNPEATPREIQLLLALAEPQDFILDEALFDHWGIEAPPGLALKVGKPVKQNLLGKLFRRPAPTTDQATETYPGLLESLPEQPAPVAPPAASLAYVLFTSGTTSRPKGVEISHGALLAHLDTLSRQFGYDTATCLLNGLPLYHADGMLQGPVAAYYNGGTICQPGPFSPQALQPFLDTIYRQRITHFVAVPTMLALIARFGGGLEDCFQTADFRFVISTAARLEEHLWLEFESRFRTRVANVYGLTETVTGSLFCGPDQATRRPGTLGKPVDCLVRVVDAGGREVAPGETGELWLAGPHLMTGYHRDPEATALVLRDGWLATGDLVRVDDAGFFQIVGRSKNVIISGGRNIAPEEVTEVLNGHPGILEAVTLGIEDGEWGEVVVACVVADPSRPADAEELQRHCHQHLSAYKVPQRLVFMHDLPKGPSGKVLLAAVRDRLADAPTAAEETALESAVEQRVLALAARCFQVDAASLTLASGPHNALGWSSLKNLEFIVALEQSFQIAIGTRDVMALQSLGDAVRIVGRLQEAKRRNS